MNRHDFALSYIFVTALAALLCCVWLAHDFKKQRDRADAAESMLREVSSDNVALRSINALLLETISRKQLTIKVAIDKRDSNGRKL